MGVSITRLTFVKRVLYLPLMNAIHEAARRLGGQKQLASALGVTPQAVSQWAASGRVPLKRVRVIAELTGWVVTPHRLMPDVYPNPQDGVPPGLSSTPLTADAEDAA